MKYFLALLCILFIAFGAWFVYPRSETVVERDFEVVRDRGVVTEKATEDSPEFHEPLENVRARVTKKPFGVYIDPVTSPVQPERFAGYHTGTDFEVFPDEEDADVVVSAICTGELLSKRTASGYGGVVVQSCKYENKPMTVVYGHVRLSSVASEIGDEIIAGEYLGYLGTGFSAETDGERKHLHLSIHRGVEEDIRGYVGLEAELSDWIDPCLLFCKQ